MAHTNRRTARPVTVGAASPCKASQDAASSISSILLASIQNIFLELIGRPHLMPHWHSQLFQDALLRWRRRVDDQRSKGLYNGDYLDGLRRLPAIAYFGQAKACRCDAQRQKNGATNDVGSAITTCADCDVTRRRVENNIHYAAFRRYPNSNIFWQIVWVWGPSWGDAQEGGAAARGRRVVPRHGGEHCRGTGRASIGRHPVPRKVAHSYGLANRINM